MAKNNYSRAEKDSYRKGLLTGLHLSKSSKSRNKSNGNKSIKRPASKEYGFLSFNDDGDVFNVRAYGRDRKDALKNARTSLKRDPERPYLGVTITEDPSNKVFFREVTVLSKGDVYDNWRSLYRSDDDDARAQYKDLSKPI